MFCQKIALPFILILTSVILMACGSNEEDSMTNENVRVIEHAMGETEIEGTPKRIVTLYQGATDAAIAFDIQPVGAVESWIEQPFYKYIRDDLEGVENLGAETQPDLEVLRKLNPDLIIASKLRHEEFYTQLSGIAPTVMEETVFEWKDTVQLMGKALEDEDKADEILQKWNDRVADFKDKAGSDILGKEVSIVRFMADHARIYMHGFSGVVLDDLGFARPENQREKIWGMQLNTKESIPQMNGDIIFDITDNYSGDAPFATREEWQDHPLWKDLDAVQNKEVYEVNSVSWNMGGGPIAANMMLDDLYEFYNLEQ
ncbi:ABC transporter substrate-binding protein [Salirhabdus salicampi]|uniref:ABC transporter substrate-binding protein n=1 Tax=Salirhabdus salicampi TaxID=476102 RepID=UPI0020C1F020|nr:iron-siderophore ABC transporter substrate-binding protein [Salirhabdus salicampi]MCP8615350.1 iron-siderophore ABC transporter substrate-binding protein [Salirhabdus salicampi]